jgi:hypothetical protein
LAALEFLLRLVEQTSKYRFTIVTLFVTAG